ncbi:MAG: hypothetical protein ACFB2W_18995 [Leptolyngbyaceae cyanobacterium]
MTANTFTSNPRQRPSDHVDLEFWQQLTQDFSFQGVDEERLRQQTEQWITCASELLGPPPMQSKRKTPH